MTQVVKLIDGTELHVDDDATPEKIQSLIKAAKQGITSDRNANLAKIGITPEGKKYEDVGKPFKGDKELAKSGDPSLGEQLEAEGKGIVGGVGKFAKSAFSSAAQLLQDPNKFGGDVAESVKGAVTHPIDTAEKAMSDAEKKWTEEANPHSTESTEKWFEDIGENAANATAATEGENISKFSGDKLQEFAPELYKTLYKKPTGGTFASKAAADADMTRTAKQAIDEGPVALTNKALKNKIDAGPVTDASQARASAFGRAKDANQGLEADPIISDAKASVERSKVKMDPHDRALAGGDVVVDPGELRAKEGNVEDLEKMRSVHHTDDIGGDSVFMQLAEQNAQAAAKRGAIKYSGKLEVPSNSPKSFFPSQSQPKKYPMFDATNSKGELIRSVHDPDTMQMLGAAQIESLQPGNGTTQWLSPGQEAKNDIKYWSKNKNMPPEVMEKFKDHLYGDLGLPENSTYSGGNKGTLVTDAGQHSRGRWALDQYTKTGDLNYLRAAHTELPVEQLEDYYQKLGKTGYKAGMPSTAMEAAEARNQMGRISQAYKDSQFSDLNALGAAKSDLHDALNMRDFLKDSSPKLGIPNLPGAGFGGFGLPMTAPIVGGAKAMDATGSLLSSIDPRYGLLAKLFAPESGDSATQ